MKTNVQALKDLYVALGGEAADVADMSTSVEVLNAISAKYEGADDAILNPDAIENIAAVADQIGGGGESGGGDSSDYSTCTVKLATRNMTSSDQVEVFLPCKGWSGGNVSSGYALIDGRGIATFTAILYQGKALAYLPASVRASYKFVVDSGSATVDGVKLNITGNCDVFVEPISA